MIQRISLLFKFLTISNDHIQHLHNLLRLHGLLLLNFLQLLFLHFNLLLELNLALLKQV